MFCFHLNKTAAEVPRMLSSTYGKAALSERTCHEWFPRLTRAVILMSRTGMATGIFEESEMEVEGFPIGT